MLELIIGPAGTGKSTALLEEIARSAARGQKCLLIVPEQYSFETEKSLFCRMGPSFALTVEVVSFTRLANLIFRRYGQLAGEYLTDTGRIALMNAALEQLAGQLKLYGRHASHPDFIRQMVEQVTQFKNSGLLPGQLAEGAEELTDTALADKVRELSLIWEAYQALVDRGYKDSGDDLARALELVRGTDFFAGYEIYLDGFAVSFLAPERELLAEMLAHSPRVTATLTTDRVSPLDDSPPFAATARTAAQLIRLARQAGVPVAAPRRMEEPFRCKNSAVRALFRSLAGEEAEPLPPGQEAVRLFAAANHYDEIEQVALEICRLVRGGCRYREIAVIARDLSPYLSAIRWSFERHGIPYFLDERKDVLSLPLAAGVLAALDAAQGDWRGESVLRAAKSPLFGLTVEEASLLENYAYIWQTRGQAWTEPFQNHPLGLSGRMSEREEELLRRTEAVRGRVMPPLIHLKEGLGGGTGLDFAQAVWNFLEEIGAAGHLREDLAGSDESSLRLNQSLWDEMMGILNLFGTVLAQSGVSAGRGAQLLRLCLGSLKLGELPQTLDQVICGTADRIRPQNPRAVFVIGANEGVFPRLEDRPGLISEEEREQLRRVGISLGESFFTLADYEEFYAYFALTCAGEWVSLSWPAADLSGQGLEPSSLVRRMEALTGPARAFDGEPLAQVTNRQTAREALLAHYGEDSPFAASLRECLRQDEAAARMVCAAMRQPFRVEDRAVTGALYGSRVILSPSRIDRHFNCPFQSFCQDALRLRPLKRAEYSPLQAGNIIHKVLEVMVRRYGGDGLAGLPEAQMQQEVHSAIHSYLASQVQDPQALGARFHYLAARLAGMLCRLLRHLGEEFAQSEYRPAYYELKIGRGGLPSLSVPLENGATLQIEGVVDRVDLLHKDGRTYVRVIDYKSGPKEFDPSELYDGLNMQMLLYLFSIWSQQEGPLAGTLPGGVLYMPARGSIISSARQEGEEKILAAHEKQWRMNGLLLDDITSLSAMEREMKGAFIPVRLKKDGTLDSCSLATLEEMGRLYRDVAGTVKKMGEMLYSGRIEALPRKEPARDVCAWCSYRRVCGFEEGDPVKKPAKFDSLQQVLQAMEEDQHG